MSFCATILLPETPLYISFSHKNIVHDNQLYKQDYAMKTPNFKTYHNHIIDEASCTIKIDDFNMSELLGREMTFYRLTDEQDLVPYFQGIIEKATSLNQQIFSLTILSYKKRLLNIRGDSYSQTCPLLWGSSACGVNKENFKKEIQITGLNADLSFSFIITEDSSWKNPPAPYLLYNNQKVEVTALSLQNGFGRFLNRVIDIGETAFLYAGCNKEFPTCKTYYSNHQNFAGFVF